MSRALILTTPKGTRVAVVPSLVREITPRLREMIDGVPDGACCAVLMGGTQSEEPLYVVETFFEICNALDAFTVRDEESK